MRQLNADSDDGGLSVTHRRGFGDARRADEGAVALAGVAFPISQRAEWCEAVGCDDSLLVIARDSADRVRGAMGVEIAPSRALPGHSLYRVERFSSTADDRVDHALLSHIVDVARRDSRCLRLTIETFERDIAARERLAQSLRALGFVHRQSQRSYARTLALDLAPGEPALLAALNLKVRRNIREPVKRGLELRSITDAALAPRLEALMAETYQRTGGSAPPLPWQTMIALSHREPNRSRIGGLFDPTSDGPEALVAFAWGALHGSYVTYEAGASTRRASLGRTPLAYAPLWDLVTWAGGTTASWFDFGGITAGTKESADDPLGGISDFKRFFCQTAVDVGDDWVLEPRAIRAAVARVASALARRFSR